MKNRIRDGAALEERRLSAAGRQAFYSGLSVQQKIDRLDLQLGKGSGAVKQRARLAKALVESAKPKEVKKSTKK